MKKNEQAEGNALPPGAIKYDGGKPPVYRGVIAYFPRAIQGVATVSGFGAAKYAWGGWNHVPDAIDRYSDALVRHIIAEGAGEVLDPESGLPHAHHIAWNTLAIAELKERDGRLELP